MNKILLILLSIFLLFTDHSYSFAKHPGKEREERISQGVYGSSKALDVGRVDTAALILDETKKVVSPPKKPLKIEELSTTKDKVKTKYVVLPAKLDGTVIKRDSAEFKELLQNQELVKKYQKSEEAWREYSNKVGETQQLLEKQREWLESSLTKANKKIDQLKIYRNIVIGVGGVIIAGLIIWLLSILGKIGVKFL